MHFKEWLNESVTFRVGGHSQKPPASIYWLGTTVDRALSQQLGQEYRQGFNHNRVDVDGLDVDAMEGRLNFYVGGLSEPLIQKGLAAIKYYVGEGGGRITGQITKDTSNMFKVPVYRIPVSVSPDQEERAPELNVASDNAEFILRDVLQLHPNVQSISVQDLLMKVGMFSDFSKQMSAESPSVERGARGLTVYNGGRSYEQIERYLATLEQMAKWAIEHHYDRIECF